MEVLTGVVAMVAVVLAVSGVLKVVEPGPTVDLFGTLGLPRSRVAAIVVGAGEIAVGTLWLSVGGVGPTVLLAAAYAAFTGLTVLTIRRAPGSSCGCFGSLSTPPGPLHVGVDAASAVLAIAAAALGAAPLVDVLDDQALGGLPYLGLVLLGSVLIIVLTTVLADALDAARRPAERATATRTFELRGTPGT